MRLTLLFVTALLFLMNCDKDPVSSPSIVSTENWQIADTEDPLNIADLTFNALSNNTVSVGGKWVYDFWGNTVTCKFLNGSAAIKNDTSFSINVNGTASYPPDEKTGYVESSPFTLKMDGTFSKAKATGTWAISFTNSEWADWGLEGAFTGTLKQGQGITK